MAAAALQAQLNALISSMHATGIVDECFQQLQSMKDQEGFVAEVINLFLRDADKMLTDITTLMNQDVVDFGKVGTIVHQLKGNSSSVGAKKMADSCISFRQSYEAESKQGCLTALDLVRNDFNDVRNKFQTIMQLEQQIAACGPK